MGEFSGDRIADDPIYLNEDRYEHPKELFKFIAQLLQKKGVNGNLLDAGCATGELIHYLKKILPGVAHFYGADVSASMIAEAKRHLPDEVFYVRDLRDVNIFQERLFDVVTCSGVLSCFDDLQIPLNNLLAGAKQNATLCIYTPINNDPVDVISRYRRANIPNAQLETGWNIFSRMTIERLLTESSYDLEWSWHPFEMPFELAKRPDDPMRTWTIGTAAKPFQTVNGACQLINGEVLIVSVNSLPVA